MIPVTLSCPTTGVQGVWVSLAVAAKSSPYFCSHPSTTGTGSVVQHGQHCHPPLRQPRSEPPHSAPPTNPLRLLAPPGLLFKNKIKKIGQLLVNYLHTYTKDHSYNLPSLCWKNGFNVTEVCLVGHSGNSHHWYCI